MSKDTKEQIEEAEVVREKAEADKAHWEAEKAKSEAIFTMVRNYAA